MTDTPTNARPWTDADRKAVAAADLDRATDAAPTEPGPELDWDRNDIAYAIVHLTNADHPGLGAAVVKLLADRDRLEQVLTQSDSLAAVEAQRYRAEVERARVALTERDRVHDELAAEAEQVRQTLAAALPTAIADDTPADLAELARAELERLRARVVELQQRLDATCQQLRDEAKSIMRHPAHPPVAADIAWQLRRIAECPVCSGPSRETTGMVCQACGDEFAAGTLTISTDTTEESDHDDH